MSILLIVCSERLRQRTCLNFCVRGGFHAVARENRSPYMTAIWFIATFQS